MAKLEKPGTNENPCAECADVKASPPLPVFKVIVICSRRIPLCKNHLEPLSDDFDNHLTEMKGSSGPTLHPVGGTRTPR